MSARLCWLALGLGLLGACGDDEGPVPPDDEVLDAGSDGGAELDASDAMAELDAWVESGAADATIEAADATIDAADATIDAGSLEPGVISLGYVVNYFYLDVFARGDRVWVSDSGKLTQYALPDGRELQSWGKLAFQGRTALDDSHLVVVNGNGVTTFTASDLSVLADVEGARDCISLVLLGSRFVCARIESATKGFLDSYDVATGALLASTPVTALGNGMRAVPGADAFVMAFASTPRSFALYQLLADGTIVAHEPEPFADQTMVSSTFEFDDAQPPHLITDLGALLRVDLTCANGCFVAEGNLGLLQAGASFDGLARDGSVLAALVSSAAPPVPEKKTSELTTIELGSRTVLTRRTIRPAHSYALSGYSHAQRRAVITAFGYYNPGGPMFSTYEVLLYPLD